MNIAANDLLKQDTSGIPWSVGVKAERRRYRVWKDAQLKEAKCLTRKRIMKALAGPKDAEFKMGDRVTAAGRPGLVVGYTGPHRAPFIQVLHDDGTIGGWLSYAIKKV